MFTCKEYYTLLKSYYGELNLNSYVIKDIQRAYSFLYTFEKFINDSSDPKLGTAYEIANNIHNLNKLNQL